MHPYGLHALAREGVHYQEPARRLSRASPRLTHLRCARRPPEVVVVDGDHARRAARYARVSADNAYLGCYVWDTRL